MHSLALGPGARAVYTTASSPALGASGQVVSFHHTNPELGQLRAELAARTGGRWLWARQTHSTTVITAAASMPSDVVGQGDAVIVLSARQIPAVVTADCLPVLLASGDGSVRAAIHAGRRGLLDGIIPATVARMRQLTGQRIYAAFGPHICVGCYEVSEALYCAARQVLGPAAGTTRWGTTAIDLAGGARSQLAQAGIGVVASAPCTLEDPQLHSYRRNATALRIASGVIARGAI